MSKSPKINKMLKDRMYIRKIKWWSNGDTWNPWSGYNPVKNRQEQNQNWKHKWATSLKCFLSHASWKIIVNIIFVSQTKKFLTYRTASYWGGGLFSAGKLVIICYASVENWHHGDVQTEGLLVSFRKLVSCQVEEFLIWRVGPQRTHPSSEAWNSKF